MKDVSAMRLALNITLVQVAETILDKGFDEFMKDISYEYLMEYFIDTCPHVVEYFKTHESLGRCLDTDKVDKPCSKCTYYRKKASKCARHTRMPIYNANETTCNDFLEKGR